MDSEPQDHKAPAVDIRRFMVSHIENAGGPAVVSGFDCLRIREVDGVSRGLQALNVKAAWSAARTDAPRQPSVKTKRRTPVRLYLDRYTRFLHSK
jgi:hypothetical protein